MSLENEDPRLPDASAVVSEKPKILYSREFLLSLSKLDICKKLPSGIDESLLSELENVPQSVLDRQRIPAPGFRRTEYGTSPPTRKDFGNYPSRNTYGKWESRSSARSDRDSDSQSDKDSDSGKRYGPPTREIQNPSFGNILWKSVPAAASRPFSSAGDRISIIDDKKSKEEAAGSILKISHLGGFNEFFLNWHKLFGLITSFPIIWRMDAGFAVRSMLIIGVGTAVCSIDTIYDVIKWNYYVKSLRLFSVGDTIKVVYKKLPESPDWDFRRAKKNQFDFLSGEDNEEGGEKVEGQVANIGLLDTVLATEQGLRFLPNSWFSNKFCTVSVTKSCLKRIIHLKIDDVEKISRISEDITYMLRSNPNVISDTEDPYCFYSPVAGSHVKLALGCNFKCSDKKSEQDVLQDAVRIIKAHGAEPGSIK